MKHLLEVKDLYKSFKKHFWSSQDLILKGLNFSIPQSSATGFLGANGSGKTTTFKCLLELIKKDSGQIDFFGSSLSLKNRDRIGFLPERPQFYENLTAKESLFFFSSLIQPLSSVLRARIEKGFKTLGLYEWRDKKLKTFSKGMLQKVGILQALVHEPDLLILDEPFSGLDPESRFIVVELLEERMKKGCTLFFSSHIFQDIEKICDRLLVIKEGELIFKGDLSQLPSSQSERHRISYLLKGKKQHIMLSSREESQKKLKNLLSEGAAILSIDNEGIHLEQKYKALIAKKKESKN